MRSAAIVARLDISERCADDVRNLLASQVPLAAVARALAKAARAAEARLCGKRGHLSHACRSSGGNANARAVELGPPEPEEEREIQHVWALSVCDTSGLPLDALSVCDNSDLPSDESGNLLSMIMDSSAEEHVVSLADWKSPGEPVLNLLEFDCSLRLVTPWEFLAVLCCVDGAIIRWWS